MILTKIIKYLLKESSIGIVIIYNSIVFIIDVLFLLVSLIHLNNGKAEWHNFAYAIIFIFSVILIPCICCGICYIWALFHIQTHLNIARFMGVCNFSFMFLTLLITIHSGPISAGFMMFFFLINSLALISVVFLCTINCGYEVVIPTVVLEEVDCQDNHIVCLQEPSAPPSTFPSAPPYVHTIEGCQDFRHGGNYC